MGSLVKAGNIADIGDGTMKKVVLQGKEVLLARVGNNYYAAANRCPHFGGDLSAGVLQGTVVTCPRHGSQFDLRDGTVVRWLKGSGPGTAVLKAVKSGRPLKTYPTRIEGDTILVQLD